jgi:Aminotransferase class-III
MMPAATLYKDAELRQRARKVVPGGMWGHLNAGNLPEGYPQFFASGEGATLVDVDGRRFIDFMCAWGPNYLGYRHPEVEEVVQRQLKDGDCLNGPGEAMVELAELFVDMIPAAEWVQFQKNGTDATTTAVTIARAATGRRKVLVAQAAYHGAVPWCSPSLLGVTAEDRAHIVSYRYNDPESLEEAARATGDDLPRSWSPPSGTISARTRNRQRQSSRMRLAPSVIEAQPPLLSTRCEPGSGSTSRGAGSPSGSGLISQPGARRSPTAILWRRSPERIGYVTPPRKSS